MAWSEVPQEVVESFYLAHPRSAWKMIQWELADMGYCARINLQPKEISSLFQANGEWLSTRWTIPEAKLPLVSHDFISDKYAFYQLRSCSYEEDRWDGRHYYVQLSIYGIDGYITEICFDFHGDVESIDGEKMNNWDEFEPLTEEEVLLKKENEMLARMQAKGDSAATVKSRLWVKNKADKEVYRAQTNRQFALARVKAQSNMARRRKDQNTSPILQPQPDTACLVINEVQPQREEAREVLEEEEAEGPYGEEYYEDYGEDYEDDGGFSFDGAIGEETVENPGERVVVEEREESRTEEKESDTEKMQDMQEAAVAEAEAPAALPNDSARVVERMQTLVSDMQRQIPAARMSVKTVFPDAVQQAFDRRFPRAENVKQYKDTSGIYRAVFVNFGQKAEAVIFPDGTHTTTALFFGKKDISYPIWQYIANAPEKYKFETGKRVVYESRYRQRFPAEEKPKNYYQVVVWVKNKETKARDYFLLTFDHKAHFVSSIPYDYMGSH
ncbi:MAG: hypothetical protein K2L50_04990 [Bacteroidales bacterium]|nr:hypothetical protein [Bacteroidales bacterium]